jgi:hypothetical protein
VRTNRRPQRSKAQSARYCTSETHSTKSRQDANRKGGAIFYEVRSTAREVIL